MKIGIIGAGHIGSTLVRHWTGLRHAVKVSNSGDLKTLSALVNDTGAVAASTPDVVEDVELLVITIPLKAVSELPKGLLENLPSSSVVLNTCNYYPSSRDGVIKEIEDGLTEGEWVSKQLNHPTIKALNNMIYQSLDCGGLPKGHQNRIALPVAGDDSKSKQMVLALLDELGFDGMDAGDLKQSWRQQPGTPVYCTNWNVTVLPKALELANRSASPQLREAAIQARQGLTPNASVSEIVRVARTPWPTLQMEEALA